MFVESTQVPECERSKRLRVASRKSICATTLSFSGRSRGRHDEAFLNGATSATLPCKWTNPVPSTRMTKLSAIGSRASSFGRRKMTMVRTTVQTNPISTETDHWCEATKSHARPLQVTPFIKIHLMRSQSALPLTSRRSLSGLGKGMILSFGNAHQDTTGCLVIFRLPSHRHDKIR